MKQDNHASKCAKSCLSCRLIASLPCSLEYRGARLPAAFWNLIAYVCSDGGLRCSAFILSQANLLNDLETLDLDLFRIHQVDLAELSCRTALDFSVLGPVDVATHPELATRAEMAEGLRADRRSVTEVRTAADIRF